MTKLNFFFSKRTVITIPSSIYHDPDLIYTQHILRRRKNVKKCPKVSREFLICNICKKPTVHCFRILSSNNKRILVFKVWKVYLKTTCLHSETRVQMRIVYCLVLYSKETRSLAISKYKRTLFRVQLCRLWEF